MRLLLTLARHAPASPEVRDRTNVDAHARTAVSALRGAASNRALSFAALLHVECLLLTNVASHSCNMSLVCGLGFAAQPCTPAGRVAQTATACGNRHELSKLAACGTCAGKDGSVRICRALGQPLRVAADAQRSRDGGRGGPGAHGAVRRPEPRGGACGEALHRALFERAFLHLSSCPNLRCIQHSLVLRWHHGPAPRPLGKVPRPILSGQPPARQRPRSRWLGGERVAAQAAVPHMQLLHRFQRADASDGWLQRAWADALAAGGRLPEAAMHFEARPPPLAHPD